MSLALDQFLGVFQKVGNVTFLINIVLKGSLILILMNLTNKLLKNASSNLRYGILRCGFALLLLVPVFQLFSPHFVLNTLPRTLNDPYYSRFYEERKNILDLVDNSPERIFGFPEMSPVPSDVETSESQALGTFYSYGQSLKKRLSGIGGVLLYWPLWPLTLWGLGILFLSTRLLMDIFAVGKILRRGTAIRKGSWIPLLRESQAQLGIEKEIRIVQSADIEIPALYGVRKPILLIPEHHHSWSLSQKEMVLLHELAHVKRNDNGIHILIRLICIFWWPNPLVWIAARKMILEREKVCDDVVLKTNHDGCTYAGFLLDLAAMLSSTKPIRSFAVNMASGRDMMERFRHILFTPSIKTKMGKKWLRVAGGFLGMLLIVLSVFILQAQKDRVVRFEPEGISQWVSDLKNGSIEIRKKAAWALGDLEHPSAVPALMDALKDSEAEVRAMAAWALGEIKATASFPALLSASADSHAFAREMIVKAIGEFGNEESLDVLIRAMHDPVSDVRYAAVWSLGEVPHEEAYASVIEALSDPDVNVREMTIQVLARQGSRETLNTLMSLLKDPESRIRERTVYALGRSQDSIAVTPLIDMAKDNVPSVRIEVARALGNLKDVKALDALMSLLRDSHPEVRAMAVWALDEIRSTE